MSGSTLTIAACRDEQGRTALHWAAFLGLQQQIALLVHAGELHSMPQCMPESSDPQSPVVLSKTGLCTELDA